MSKSEKRAMVALHAILLLYSFSGIASKTAAQQPFMSLPFIFWYGVMVAILGVYAIVWQQVIKRVPLTTAYANKAVTIVWGLVWGAVIFHESITPLKLLGAAIVLAGVIFFVRADAEDGPDDSVPADVEVEGGDA